MRIAIFCCALSVFFLANLTSSSPEKKHHKKKEKGFPLANITFANSTLIWISSLEDLATHFLHTARYWRAARLHNRTLTVITYTSDMYGRDSIVNFCDIFNPPPGLYCLSVSREDITSNKTCTRAPMDVDPTTGKVAKKNTNPASYGLAVVHVKTKHLFFLTIKSLELVCIP